MTGEAQFYSITYRCFKLPSLERTEEDYGRRECSFLSRTTYTCSDVLCVSILRCITLKAKLQFTEAQFPAAHLATILT